MFKLKRQIAHAQSRERTQTDMGAERLWEEYIPPSLLSHPPSMSSCLELCPPLPQNGSLIESENSKDFLTFFLST